MELKQALSETIKNHPEVISAPDHFIALVFDLIGDDYRAKKAAKIFYMLDKQIKLAAFFKEEPNKEDFEKYCAEHKGDREQLAILTDALFETWEVNTASIKKAPRKNKQPPAPTPKRQKQSPPKAKSPQRVTLSQFDENTLVHYASSNPYTGSDDTLHVDFDCPRLAGAWCVFRQPLFEAKEQTDRKWKLCPHCVGVSPMLFSPQKAKGLFAPNFHLTVMDESQKKKARKQRGF